MTRISWKENRVLSIETRKGVYVVGQMLKQPYIRFYNMFTAESSPNNVNTIKLTVLFTAAITRQFLRYSQVYVLKDATPDIREIDSDIWINQFSGSRKVIAYQGSGEEIGCMILGNKPGGLLVKKIYGGFLHLNNQFVYIQVEFLMKLYVLIFHLPPMTL